MKPLASARTAQSVLPTGQLLLTIEHDTVRGVTPAMLRWWFETLGETMTYEGVTYDGGTGQGAHFRIVEAFGANPAYYVDSTEFVERLDEGGITLVRRILGVEVFRLQHRFGDARGGASYRSRMVVGALSGRFGAILNAVVRPRVFSDAMGTAWVAHNVEEVSMLEHILPALYRVGGSDR